MIPIDFEFNINMAVGVCPVFTLLMIRIDFLFNRSMPKSFQQYGVGGGEQELLFSKQTSWSFLAHLFLEKSRGIAIALALPVL